MTENEWWMLAFVAFLTVAYFVMRRVVYANGVWDGAYNAWRSDVRAILDSYQEPGSPKAVRRERARELQEMTEAAASAAAQHEAAEMRVEELEDEVSWLRKALARMVYETTRLSALEDDGSHRCVISSDALAEAREVLADTSA